MTIPLTSASFPRGAECDRSEAEVRATLALRRAPRLVARFLTDAGSPVKAELWNPTPTNVAAFYECEESDVDFSENEDGDEIVTVKGAEVGKVERF